MDRFVGRAQELARLDGLAERVAAQGAGALLAVRGRRQVGKSRLLEEFLCRSGRPGVFFAASRGAAPAGELAAFVDAVSAAGVEPSPLFSDVRFDSWGAAFRALAAGISQPLVVVLDELPYLLAGDPALEGTLQQVWDRALSRAPVLLVLVGSDLSVMELLATYDRPLYGRAQEMLVRALTTVETAELLDLPAAAAFDAQLVTGGLPRLLQEWGPGRGRREVLAEQFADATSPLVVVGERTLAAELPAELQARRVLEVIGSGASAYGTIATRAGVPQQSLARTLDVLVGSKRLVRREQPLSTAASRLSRYVVADPYLRFWLRFVGPQLELLLRGRGDLVGRTVEEQWPDFRGGAVEPLVREAVERLLPDSRFGAGQVVGTWWDRRGTEVDLVIADRERDASTVTAVGSVKWRERAPFDRRDQRALERAAAAVPGAAAAFLVAVSHSGAEAGVTVPVLGPTDLLGKA